MIIIVIAILSMFVLAGLAWLTRRILQVSAICPVCAGVAGTWFWIVVGMYFGVLQAESWKLIAAIAMGGSVVGIAYQAEKRLASRCSPMLWKMLFIPTGFVLVYSVLSWWWTGAVVSFALCIVWLMSCVRIRKAAGERHDFARDAAAVKMLEEKMKNNCC